MDDRGEHTSDSADAHRLKVARAMLWTVLAAIIFIRVASGRAQGSGWEGVGLAALSYPPLIVLLAREWRLRIRILLVTVLAVTAVLPFVFVGNQWDWIPWAVAAGVLCALPRRVAWPLFGAILTAVAVYALTGIRGPSVTTASDAVSNTIGHEIVTVDDALILFSLLTLARMLRCLQINEEEAARLARIRERLRIDGELREVVGRSFQAILFRLRRASVGEMDTARLDIFAAAETPRGTDRPTRADDTRLDILAAAETSRATLDDVRSLSDSYRAAPPSASRAASTSTSTVPAVPIESPRVARTALVTVALIQCALVMDDLYASAPGGWFALEGAARFVVAWPLIILLAATFAFPPGRTILTVKSALILAPLLILDAASWTRTVPLLAGSLLVRLRPQWSWPATALLFAGLAWMLNTRTDRPLSIPASLVGNLIITTWVYSVTRLADLVVTLRTSRRELTASAIATERTRIAQDLHDTLGFRLSAVALKGELTARLLERDPGRARTELDALIEAVSDGIAELGAISGDQVRLDWRAEADAARDLLEAAGIRTVLDVAAGPGPLADDVDTALALAVREAVTNVLRHSTARTCEISITAAEGSVRLRVLNDGVAAADNGAESTSAARRGTGLENLRRRASGGLTITTCADGATFELIAKFSTTATEDSVRGADAARDALAP